MHINGDIGQQVLGDSYTERMHISLPGVSDRIAQLEDAQLQLMERRLRRCRRHRYRKVGLVRVVFAAAGLLLLLAMEQTSQGHGTAVQVAAMGSAIFTAWLLYHQTCGDYVQEQLMTIRIEAQQLAQVNAEMDQRGIGTGDRHILRDLQAGLSMQG